MLQTELIGLLEELLRTGGNHDKLALVKIEEKFLNFLGRKENVMGCSDDINIVLAKDAIRLIDASCIYATTTDRIEASKSMQPFFDRILEMEWKDWNYYDLLMLVCSINYTETDEQAVALAHKTTLPFIKFKEVENIGVVDGGLSCNLCSRLVYAEFFDEAADFNLISEEFYISYNRLIRLAEDHSSLALPLLVTKIREAVLKQRREEQFTLLDELKANYDENIYSAISSEVSFYRVAERYDSRLHKDIFGFNEDIKVVSKVL